MLGAQIPFDIKAYIRALDSSNFPQATILRLRAPNISNRRHSNMTALPAAAIAELQAA